MLILKKVLSLILILSALLLCGCAKTPAPAREMPPMGGRGGAPVPPAGDVQVTPSALDTDDLFTERDMAGAIPGGAVEIALTESGADCSSPAVTVEGSTVKITDEGCYILSGSLEGTVIVDAEKTDKVQLVLSGARISCKSSAAIYVKQAKKVFLTLAEDSDNALSNGGSFTAIDQSNIDAVVFSKDDLTLNGSGRLSLSSPAGHGIVSKNDLAVCGGDWSISAGRHGLCGDDSVRIGGGSVNITAGKKGIKAESEEADKGYICITGGAVTVSSEKDALSATGEVLIAGGAVSLNRCSEGIEAPRIELRFGAVSINAGDDGINASSDKGSDCAVLISGGALTINAGGDGIDSNGALLISGGAISIFADDSRDDSALDYDAGGSITGGSVIACGGAEMAMSFSESSTQGSILVNTGKQAASAVTLTDKNGNKLLSAEAPKAYSSVLISCPEIKEGGTYTLTAGSFTRELTMESLVYGEGGMGDFPGGRPEGGIPGGKPEGDFPGGRPGEKK